MIARRSSFASALLVASLALLPATAHAAGLRTVRVSANRQGADGPSANPAISATGRFVAFDTSGLTLPGTALNGARRDVVEVDHTTGASLLISASNDGNGADADSLDPAMDGSGRYVAFTSSADNLVDGDTNGQPDVFVRDILSGTTTRVSVPALGGEADGPSGEPDVSKNGRFVVFSSRADNLVPGDTNGRSDIFVRDLATNTTRRISQTPAGTAAAGDSVTPSIAASGQYVVFASTAPDLVSGDTNGIMDVFEVELATLTTTRVSLAADGSQQTQSVIAPFAQISDVSSDGRYVVFDSDSPKLVPGDTNQDTDVFLRDTTLGSTTRVSVGTGGSEGDNDSFDPSMSPNGRFITFESFAENLAPGDATGEDVFVHDRQLDATIVADVSARGKPRDAEAVKQLLQRPQISEDGYTVAFSSTADNLVGGDTNGLQDVFLRLAKPTSGRVVHPPSPTRFYAFKSTDSGATQFLCKLDNKSVFLCPRSGRLPAMKRGRHYIQVRPGGPGIQFGKPLPIMRFRVK